MDGLKEPPFSGDLAVL